MSWLDALGWAGSALLIYSLLQARVLRFRALNLVASSVLVVFNALLGIWPMVAMNAVLAGINLWFIRRLLRSGTTRAPTRCSRSAPPTRTSRTCSPCTARTSAGSSRGSPGPVPDDRLTAFLVQHGDETVGVVLVRDAGRRGRPGRARLRHAAVPDFTPGEFVYRRSGLFRDRGFRRVLTPPGMVAPYYDRLGFRQDGDAYCPRPRAR